MSDFQTKLESNLSFAMYLWKLNITKRLVVF